MTDSSDEACAVALVTLPGMGPATLVRLLQDLNPGEAWRRICSGDIVPPPTSARMVTDRHRSWAHVASRIDPQRLWDRYAAAGVQVTWRRGPAYPIALVDDPSPPGVLFWRGRIAILDHPCVAVVGTRRATPEGRAVAFEMGRDLASAGVCVVSGLALGIDGAAHLGALRGVGHPSAVGPVGVAASGVDVPYPRQHRRLWEQVVEAGAILSETAPARPAEAWRFPSRNRIIAGLVRMVVVVESHAAGGSLITAEAALARGVDLRVVPGSVRSSASEGSNQLLYDGPGPVRDAQDVLDAIGMLRLRVPRPAERRPSLGADAARALVAVGTTPTSMNQIVERCGLPVAATVRALEELLDVGLLREEGGWWTQDVATRSREDR